MAETLIPVSSSWLVQDGIVWPLDVLPPPHPVQGKTTAARAKIREAVLAARKR